jgi:hypothetical protein
MSERSEARERFRVDTATHVLGGLAARFPSLLVKLGNLETRWLADELEEKTIRAPVFVCGLARAGTTILLEFLAGLPNVATHRYRDFPFVHVPFWWNRFLDLAPRREGSPTERAHGDGIEVTSESPEAMEEGIWMTFFPDAHNPEVSAVLDADTGNEAFERFYRDHIRKLLLVRAGDRYVAKGNYNVTRLDYLLKLFPDARFVVPVRDPVSHVYSLIRQQRNFLRGQQGNPRAVEYLRRIGHFEFGIDRRPIDTGDAESVRRVIALWQAGEEVEGWALYWRMMHELIVDRVMDNARLCEAVMVVRYEDLCARPEPVLAELLAHCRLAEHEGAAASFAARVRAPDYYSRDLTERELEIIRDRTGAVASRLGYTQTPMDPGGR